MDKSNSYTNNTNNPNIIAQQNYGNENTNNYPQSDYTGSSLGNGNLNNYPQSNYADSHTNNNTDSWGSNNANYNIVGLPNDYQQNNILNNGININYDDIDISYTYNVPKDDIKANRETIVKYLESSDPYNMGVVYGHEKEVTDNPKGSKKFVPIFLGVGIGVLTLVFILAIITDYELFNVLANFIFGVLCYAVFVVFGLHIALTPRKIAKIKKARCKQMVNAKIVDEREIYCDSDTKKFLPIYKFIYNNRIYIISAKTTTDFLSLNVGQYVRMFINEYDPEDIYVETQDGILQLIIGLLFACALLLAIFSYIISMF